MKLFNVAFSLFLMKKWSGGVVIVALAFIFIFSYTLMSTSTQQQPPHKTGDNNNNQSAYDFFRTHPPPSNKNDSLSKGNGQFDSMVGPPPPPSSNKPAFRIVEELSDLYALNVSKEESKAFLVWPELRMLLSRSDALPETAQGIKEASIAWKELLPLIEEERAAKLVNSDKSKDKSCPYSVSTVDLLQVPNNETILDIPCGLIEDSSFTLVGIPGGQNHSFEIELTGSRLEGETRPSVIMLYKVRIPGENMTEGPFIVQNSWTRDGGWGNEERCPSHDSANVQKVDGLVRCNEEVVGSTNHNASRPDGDAAGNSSRESVHTDANLPFVERNLVAATLWLGPEGFHMTVNGRPETSFPFRE